MERRRMTLILLGLSIVLMAESVQAIPVNYKFSVTATSGPLMGVTAVGTFAFDSSIIPVGGGHVPGAWLLTDLNLTWDGIAYNAAIANTGWLDFNSSGYLTGVNFGNNHSAQGTQVDLGQEQWMASTNAAFKYSILDGSDIWDGTFRVKRVGPDSIDYDGDGKTDIAVYRASTGAWYVKPSSGASPYGVGWGGNPNDKPVPGDYDGDLRTDIAVYRANTGAWYVKPSSGASPYGVGWGGDPNDKPVPGDYDGDLRTDIAVYRANTGAWYVKPSSGASPYGVGWGGDPNDKPVPGDYDGDGKTDIAVYRASTGAWYVKPSSGASAYGIGWGGDPTDKPVPGDYDGDGKTDFAVYRAGTGAWYVYPSGGSAPYGLGWGGDDTDVPVSMIASIY